MSTLLTADAVVTVDAARTVIPEGAVLVDGNRIIAVGPTDQLIAEHPEATVTALPGRLLMPGLINSHSHSGLLRGTAEALPVWEWLRVHIDPMHRVVTAAEAEAASWLCYAESVLAGTTTVVDMWRHMHGSVAAATGVGNRLVTVNYVGAHPDFDYFDTLDDNEQLLQHSQGAANGRVSVWVGLEHVFYADAAGQRRAIDMARDHNTGFYTHCSESEIEIAEFDKRYGSRPMPALERLGFFDVPRTMLAHAVWLDDSEIALLAQRGVAVVHNPVSNMKLASGVAPIERLLAAGVIVGLGTDGEKENNNLDMFEEMKAASLLAKLSSGDAAALDSWKVIEMATINGARGLGLDADIGSLEPGKKADLIAVRTDTPRMTPFFPQGPYFNLQHNLVHAVRGSDVDLTMIDGQVVVRDGQLVSQDLPDIIARARAVVPGLFKRRADWLADHDDLEGVFGAND